MNTLNYLQSNKILLFSAILFLLLGVNAYHATIFYTPDEYYQIIEFASFKLGYTKASHLAWEYGAMSRQALQPFLVYGLFKFFQIIGLENHLAQIFGLRMINSFIFVISLAFYISRTKHAIKEAYRNHYLLFSFFFWVIPCYYFRFSQEVVSQSLYLIIIGLLINDTTPKFNKNFLIGLLIGMAFIIRYQSIISFFGISLFWILNRKDNFKDYIKHHISIGFGVLIMVGIGILIDYWFYDRWILMPYRYFYYQIVLKIANGFGKEPFYYYLLHLLIFSFPLLGFLIYRSFYSLQVKKWTIMHAIIISSVFILSLIGHKEDRFLLPIYMFIPYVIFYSYQNKPFKSLRIEKILFTSIFSINFIYIIISTMFNLQIISDQEKSLQGFVIRQYSNYEKIELISQKKCNPFMDYVKNDYFPIGNQLFQDFVIPKNFKLTIIDTTYIETQNSKKHVFYLSKASYHTIFDQSSIHPMVKSKSIPYFLDSLIDKYPVLSNILDKNIIYVSE